MATDYRKGNDGILPLMRDDTQKKSEMKVTGKYRSSR